MEYCARLAVSENQQDGSEYVFLVNWGYGDSKHLRVELGDQACQPASRPSLSRSGGLSP